jgi:hypothetical protein
LKEKLKQLELYLKACVLTEEFKGLAIALPLAVLYFLGYFEYAPAVVIGAF